MMANTPKPPPDADRPPAEKPNPVPPDKDEPREKIEHMLTQN